jgi:predicted CXXCH cytochrome family protein
MRERVQIVCMLKEMTIGICLRRKFAALLLFFFLLFPLSLFTLPLSSSGAPPTHLDKTKVKAGCSACHKGHGQKGTTLLSKAKDEFCLSCHSLSGKASDITSELAKPSNHRIRETAMYHVPGEELPEKDSSTPRHASCYDCHNVHQSEKGDRIQGLKGLRGSTGKGVKTRQVNREYQLCYNCHADSANIQREESNVSQDFSSSNGSYHPVETRGKGTIIPSLKKGFTPSSLIDCSDCHGNDNPAGPKGPHGSIYKPLLKHPYERSQGTESPRSYELCYSCHDRTSILGDESFKSHKVHIVYNRLSCALCHAAHGSKFNPALIKFDPSVVFPTALGEMTFMSMFPGRPRCYLSCHVGGKIYEHKLDKNLRYCINSRCMEE